jgi:hypothetical protein
MSKVKCQKIKDKMLRTTISCLRARKHSSVGLYTDRVVQSQEIFFIIRRETIKAVSMNLFQILRGVKSCKYWQHYKWVDVWQSCVGKKFCLFLVLWRWIWLFVLKVLSIKYPGKSFLKNFIRMRVCKSGSLSIFKLLLCYFWSDRLKWMLNVLLLHFPWKITGKWKHFEILWY